MTDIKQLAQQEAERRMPEADCKESGLIAQAIRYGFVEGFIEGHNQRWIPVSEAMPKEEDGRVLTYSPVYDDGDPMKFRILDAQFVRIAKDVTHWQLIYPPKS